MTGNTDYSVLEPNSLDWVASGLGAAKGAKNLLSSRGAGEALTAMSGAGDFNTVVKGLVNWNPLKADEILFEVLSQTNQQVTVGGESYSLLEFRPGGEGITSLKLNDELREAFDDFGLDPVDQFAHALGGFRRVAENLVDHYSQGRAKQMFRNYVKATEQIEAGEGNETACNAARSIASKAGVEVEGC